MPHFSQSYCTVHSPQIDRIYATGPTGLESFLRSIRCEDSCHNFSNVSHRVYYFPLNFQCFSIMYYFRSRYRRFTIRKLLALYSDFFLKNYTNQIPSWRFRFISATTMSLELMSLKAWRRAASDKESCSLVDILKQTIWNFFYETSIYARTSVLLYPDIDANRVYLSHGTSHWVQRNWPNICSNSVVWQWLLQWRLSWSSLRHRFASQSPVSCRIR